MSTPREICSAILLTLPTIGLARSADERMMIASEIVRVSDAVLRTWLPTVDVSWLLDEEARSLPRPPALPREDVELVWARVERAELDAITAPSPKDAAREYAEFTALEAYPPLALFFALEACAAALELDLGAGYGVLTSAGDVWLGRGAFERSMVIKASRRLLDVADHVLRGLLSREFGVQLASVRSIYRGAEGSTSDLEPAMRALESAGAGRLLESAWETLRALGVLRRVEREAASVVGSFDWLLGSARLSRRDVLRVRIDAEEDRMLVLSRRVRALIQQTRDRDAPWHEVRDAFVVMVFAFRAVAIDPLFGLVANLGELLGAHQNLMSALARHAQRDAQLDGAARALDAVVRGLRPNRTPFDNAYALVGRASMDPILRELGRLIVQRFGVMQATEELLEQLARSESPLVPVR